MMDDIMTDVQKRKENNIPIHYYHRIGTILGQNMAELADQAGIKPVPPVLGKLYSYHALVAKGDRTAIYKIINDDEFLRIK